MAAGSATAVAEAAETGTARAEVAEAKGCLEVRAKGAAVATVDPRAARSNPTAAAAVGLADLADLAAPAEGRDHAAARDACQRRLLRL